MHKLCFPYSCQCYSLLSERCMASKKKQEKRLYGVSTILGHHFKPNLTLRANSLWLIIRVRYTHNKHFVNGKETRGIKSACQSHCQKFRILLRAILHIFGHRPTIWWKIYWIWFYKEYSSREIPNIAHCTDLKLCS